LACQLRAKAFAVKSGQECGRGDNDHEERWQIALQALHGVGFPLSGLNFLVTLSPEQDLLLRAKYLFVAAMVALVGTMRDDKHAAVGSASVRITGAKN
jgi:hypothetical protein